MSYNALDGKMTANNVTFANFGVHCADVGSRDFVITTNPANEDGQHPVSFSDIHLFNVDSESKVFIHRPNLGKINPSDCVDMNCEGLKKNLLTDEDGSFLGTPGTVISQSEFGWGDQARGLGDYRIPKEALADSAGHLKNMSLVYKHRGLVRDENTCTYQSDWQAYECHGVDHRMMMIESMDKDTENRRLSPIAIISDGNNYIDLINGPQGSFGFMYNYKWKYYFGSSQLWRRNHSERF